MWYTGSWQLWQSLHWGDKTKAGEIRVKELKDACQKCLLGKSAVAEISCCYTHQTGRRECCGPCLKARRPANEGGYLDSNGTTRRTIQQKCWHGASRMLDHGSPKFERRNQPMSPFAHLVTCTLRLYKQHALTLAHLF